MENLFVQTLQNSLAGSAFLILVFVFRHITRRLSKTYVRLLWLFFPIIMLAPPLFYGSMPTVRSLITREYQQHIVTDNAPANAPGTQTGQSARTYAPAASDAIQTPAGQENAAGTFPGQKNTAEVSMPDSNAAKAASTVSSYGPDGSTASGISSIRPDRPSRILHTAAALWVAGMITMAVNGLIRYLLLLKSVSGAKRVAKDLWLSEAVKTPFVLPHIPARIYLPRGIPDAQRQDIIAHERQHIKNLDPLWKCIGSLTLMVHWFNPLAWAAFSAMGKDIEMYCDECVLHGKPMAERKRYSGTLLSYSAKKSGLALPMYFGESNTESRIRHILYSKKPRRFVSILLLLTAIGAGICFVTDSAATASAPDPSSTANSSFASKNPNPGQNTDQDQNTDPNQYADRPGSSTADDADQDAALTTADNIRLTEEGAVITARLPLSDTVSNREIMYYEEILLDEAQTNALHAQAAASDYSSSWEAFTDACKNNFSSVKDANLLKKTSQFKLYGLNNIEDLLVETPDNRYVCLPGVFLAPPMGEPQVREQDFDLDGAPELAISLCMDTGSGYSVASLYMVDQSQSGAWRMYLLPKDTGYLPQLQEHYSSVGRQDGLYLAFDGKTIGYPEDNDPDAVGMDYHYEAGWQIEYRFASNLGNNVCVIRALLGGFSNIAMGDTSAGHGIQAQIQYLGNGRFELMDFSYFNSNLDTFVADCIRFCYPHETRWQGYNLEKQKQFEEGNAKMADVEIVGLHYDLLDTAAGKATLTATVCPNQPDATYEYITLDLVQEKAADDADWQSWTVENAWIEK